MRLKALNGSINLFLSNGLVTKTLSDFHDPFKNRFSIRTGCALSEKERESRIMERKVRSDDRGSPLCLYKFLVQPPAGLRNENVRQHRDRRRFRVRSRWDVVHCPGPANFANASDRDESLALLRGLFCVGVGQFSRGARYRAKVLDDVLLRRSLVKLPGNDQHGVVWLVVLAVEGLQVLDWNAFDVGFVSDRCLPVVVPLER